VFLIFSPLLISDSVRILSAEKFHGRKIFCYAYDISARFGLREQLVTFSMQKQRLIDAN